MIARAPPRHRFLCPRCRSALTPWLRELTLGEAICQRANATSLLPGGFFAHRDAPLFGDDFFPPYESFPWLLAPLGEKWLAKHPDPARTVGCCGLAHHGEDKPNLRCPRGHDVGIGYRDCSGPHWYALHQEVERQSEPDPTPLADPAPKLDRARALVDHAPPPLAHFLGAGTDVFHDEPNQWLDALWLEAPSLECSGGQEAPSLVLRGKGLPDGQALFLPTPWPVLVRLLCLDEALWGSTDLPLTWQGHEPRTINVSRYGDFVLLTVDRRDPTGRDSVVFDAAEWAGAWARLRGLG
jgi:hypothetical protein